LAYFFVGFKAASKYENKKILFLGLSHIYVLTLSPFTVHGAIIIVMIVVIIIPFESVLCFI
jgi:hypothetical protein